MSPLQDKKKPSNVLFNCLFLPEKGSLPEQWSVLKFYKQLKGTEIKFGVEKKVLGTIIWVYSLLWSQYGLLVIKIYAFQLFSGSKTLDYQYVGEMFRWDFADICSKKFPLVLMRVERMDQHAGGTSAIRNYQNCRLIRE